MSALDAMRVSARMGVPRPAAARRSCIVLAAVAVLLAIMMLAVPRPAHAQAMRGEMSLTVADGYGRLLLKFPQSLDVQTRMSGNILIISFPRPVDVPVERILAGAADWIGAARRDPNGMALRIALARKFRLNKIDAGEQIFIDLLPEGWTAAPPGPPPDVVAELARRAREAERAARARAELEHLKQDPPVRVSVATQPTFTRYTFELKDLVGVSTDRGRDRLVLTVAAALRFDLADVRLAQLPPVGRIDADIRSEATQVTFTFNGPADVRTFREDNNYVVDVIPLGGRTAAPRAAAPPPAVAPPAMRLSGLDAPQTIPAAPVAAPAPAPAVAPSTAPAATVPPAPAPVAAKPEPPSPPQRMEAAAEPPPPEPQAKPEPPPAPVVVSAPAPPATAAAPARPGATVMSMQTSGDAITLAAPFQAATPAAVFVRGETLWMVFDSATPIDVSSLTDDATGPIRAASATREGDAHVVRLRLDRPRTAALADKGTGWSITLADAGLEPSKPLTLTRRSLGGSRSGAIIAFEKPGKIHWLRDPDLGDTLMVVTGLGPARGFARTQTLLEFAALMSVHGVVIERYADDLTAEIAADGVRIGRPAGLTLSAYIPAGRRGESRAQAFDPQLWGFDRQTDFGARQGDLSNAAADAQGDRRNGPRLDLARFYLSRELYAEAKAVLDIALAEDRPNASNATPYILRAVASIMLGRHQDALTDLSNPLLAGHDDAQLWRAMALAKQGKWGEAREAFRRGELAMSTLPVELQRLVLRENLRSAIETGDFATGSVKLDEFESIGLPRELQPSIAVMTGRLHEGMGRKDEALASYKLAAESWDRPAAAQGRLREIMLNHASGAVQKPEAIAELETLVTMWRGDETEIEGLQTLSRLYTEEGRYRDAFHVMRTALTAYPNSERTRRMQDAAVMTFDSLFLSGKADAMSAIDGLALFYDFRELMPIGRRGDEMIRRLADRLVAVDLLDQAADLLQHQVDHRLQGAARAQVATRLATIYLMARKPDRAQAALRATRTNNISSAARRQRILLEARAMADIGRGDAALEAIETVEGPQAVRLRADIHWAAQRWREAAEQIELLLGDRWKQFTPLDDAERSDVLRAAVGYALAEDAIGMGRLREKYEARMVDTADQRHFQVLAGGLGTDSAEFREVARAIAKADTLEPFLRDMRRAYPDNAPAAGGSSGPHAALASGGDVTASIPLPRPRVAQRAPLR